MQLRAALIKGIPSEPGKQRGTVPARTVRRQCHQVIDVQKPTPGEILRDTESRDRHRRGRFRHAHQAVSGSLLRPDPGNEALLRNMRAQFPHDGIAGCDLLIRFSEIYVHSECRPDAAQRPGAENVCTRDTAIRLPAEPCFLYFSLLGVLLPPMVFAITYAVLAAKEATAGLLIVSTTFAWPGLANLGAVLLADRQRGR